MFTAHVDGDDGALGDPVAQEEVGDPVHHRRQVSAEVKMQGRKLFHDRFRLRSFIV